MHFARSLNNRSIQCKQNYQACLSQNRPLRALDVKPEYLKLCGFVNRSGKRAICEAVKDAGGKLFQVKFVALTKFLVLLILLREQLKERK